MATNLNGGAVTETFTTSGADLNGPYTNSSSQAATLTLSLGQDVTVTEGKDAIDQTAGKITLIVDSAGSLGAPGVLALDGPNTYSGGTEIDDSVVEVGDDSALGSSGIEFLGTSGALEVPGNEGLVQLVQPITIAPGASARFAAAGQLILGGDELMGGGAGTTIYFGGNGLQGNVALAPSSVTANSFGSIEIDSGAVALLNASAISLFSSMLGGVTVGGQLFANTQDLLLHNLKGAANGDIGEAPTLTVDESADTTFAGGIFNSVDDLIVESDGAHPYADGRQHL